ncbi:MAG: type II toxin-antitoxin system prevent-host-death family antitoxin [Pseudomonadota bacterium]
MNKVTSGEFQKEFGRYRTEAHKDAVIITNHGRDDLALISAEEYKRLRQLDQQAFYAHELPNEVLSEIGTLSIPEEAKQFNDEYPS